MTESMFLGLVGLCFGTFIVALVWAQLTTPSRLDDHA